MSPLEMAKSSRPGFALRGRGLRGHGAREAACDLRLPRGAATGLDQAAAGGPADAVFGVFGTWEDWEEPP